MSEGTPPSVETGDTSVDGVEIVEVMSSEVATSSGSQQQSAKERYTLPSENWQKQSCSSIDPPASRPSHEGDHVRKGRMSTSDARKADHEVSSRIVSLSSATVMPRITTHSLLYIIAIAAGEGSRAGKWFCCALRSALLMLYNTFA